MSTSDVSKHAGATGAALRDAAQAGIHRARKQGACLFDEASACIRKNPVAVVAGALAVGVALGCLIAAGRHAMEDDDDFLEEVGESISHSANRLLDTLKFW